MTDDIKQAISVAKTGTTYKSRPLKSEEHKKKIADSMKKIWNERRLSK
jgi:hypothetical protein